MDSCGDPLARNLIRFSPFTEEMSSFRDEKCTAKVQHLLLFENPIYIIFICIYILGSFCCIRSPSNASKGSQFQLSIPHTLFCPPFFFPSQIDHPTAASPSESYIYLYLSIQFLCPRKIQYFPQSVQNTQSLQLYELLPTYQKLNNKHIHVSEHIPYFSILILVTSLSMISLSSTNMLKI